MAILNRRGNKANFDPSKLLAGEFAFSLDTSELFYCVSPGNVKRCATKEDIQDILNSSQDAYDRLMELVDTLEDDPALSTSILTDIANLKINKLDKTGDTKDNITTFTEAATETNIVSGEKQSTLFGKILKSIKTFRTNIGTLTSLTTTIKTSLVAAVNELVSGKIDKTSIINNDTTGGTDKVASAEVVKVHGQEIDELNNNLSNILNLNNTFVSNLDSRVAITTIGVRKRGNVVQIYMILTLTNVPNEATLFKVSHTPMSIYFIQSLRRSVSPYGLAEETVWFVSNGDVKLYTSSPVSGTYYLSCEYTHK